MKTHRLAAVICQDKKTSLVGGDAYGSQLEQRLRVGLDGRCEVTRHERKIFAALVGDLTEDQRERAGQSVARIWEWEGA